MLVLASASPRRQELLRLITDDFEVVAADVDESFAPGTPPKEVVEILASRKARAISALRPDDTVIGADTIVAVGETILGKPRDRREAASMLRLLSGRAHMVYTGVSIVSKKVDELFVSCAQVAFFELGDSEIESYVATGEPLDKAGAYGIQGRGALLVSGINGDFYTIMGLPVAELYRRLKNTGSYSRFGVIMPDIPLK